MQKIKTYKEYIEIASLFFALLIAFWIPEFKFILSYFIGAWFFLTIVQLNFRNRFKETVNSKFKKFIFFSQLILFLIIFSELFFAENTKEVSKNITQKLSFLLFPILFSLSGNKFKQNKNLFLKLFVVSNIVASVICLLSAFYNSSSFVNGHYVFNPVIIEGWQYYFSGTNFSFFLHRGYFSMYLVFSIAILFYFKEKHIWFNSSKKKIWFYTLIVFFTVIIFMLSSRAGMISLFIIISWFVIYKIFLSKDIRYKIATIAVIIFMAIVVFQSSRIQKTVKKLTKIENTVVGKNTDARIVLWVSAIDLINKNFFTGVGIENFKKEFSKEYRKYNNNGLRARKDMNYNVHNQFLEIWVLYGFFVFMFFISIFLVLIISSFKSGNNLLLAFLVILGFNFMFESVLEKITGIIFSVYFLNYFVFVFDEKQIQNSNLTF